MIGLAAMAMATGFLGAGHCLGMCGGLVCSLAMTDKGRSGPAFHLAYNAGRVTTYTGIGALSGWAGSAMVYTRNFAEITRTAMALSDLFVIAVGLATLLAFRPLSFRGLESGRISRVVGRIAGWAARIPGLPASLILGLVMGFLPCGFLYAILITAAGSASPLAGAVIMLAFGLGTAPALVGFGWLAGMIGSRTRGRMLLFAGLLVTLMGVYNLYRHLLMLDWVLAAIPFASVCCQ